MKIEYKLESEGRKLRLSWEGEDPFSGKAVMAGAKPMVELAKKIARKPHAMFNPDAGGAYSRFDLGNCVHLRDFCELLRSDYGMKLVKESGTFPELPVLETGGLPMMPPEFGRLVDASKFPPPTDTSA